MVQRAFASGGKRSGATEEDDDDDFADLEGTPEGDAAASLISEFVQREPDFLQWFVQLHVPEMAEQLGDVDADDAFDPEAFVRDAYQRWCDEGKPVVDSPDVKGL